MGQELKGGLTWGVEAVQALPKQHVHLAGGLVLSVAGGLSGLQHGSSHVTLLMRLSSREVMAGFLKRERFQGEQGGSLSIF